MSFWAFAPRSVGVVRRAVGLALFMVDVLGYQKPPEEFPTVCRAIVSFVKARFSSTEVRRHAHPLSAHHLRAPVSATGLSAPHAFWRRPPLWRLPCLRSLMRHQ